MDYLKKVLETREKNLLKLKEEKEKALQETPEGFLRINNYRNRPRYYQRLDPKDFNGTYIKEQDFVLAQKLAQKEYDQKVLHSIEKELSAIRKYQLDYPLIPAEQIYNTLHKERQKLITPIRETDEQYVKRWKSVPYEGKGFQEEAPEFYTENGERVRSKSEWIIADLLKKEGIPYRYECPLYLNGIGKIYPDFTVLNVKLRKEIYWEHLGMMDDPSYAENALKRITIYEQNGIFIGDRLITTYETRKTPISQKQILRMIRHFAM